MILIKRILGGVLAVISSLVFIILLAMINGLSGAGLTGGQVVLYGLITGILVGAGSGFLLINLLVRKTRNFINTRLGTAAQRFTFVKRV